MGDAKPTRIITSIDRPHFAWLRGIHGTRPVPTVFHDFICPDDQERVIKKFPLRDGEELIRLDELATLYPLEEEIRPQQVVGPVATAVLLLFVVLLSSGAFGAELAWKRSFAPDLSRLHVVDGDTFCYDSRPSRRERICYRLYGVDAPELHVPCERQKAQRAKDALLSFTKSGRVLIRAARRTDKYGRTYARLLVGKADAGRVLIEKGLARPYFGGKRKPWC